MCYSPECNRKEAESLGAAVETVTTTLTQELPICDHIRRYSHAFMTNPDQSATSVEVHIILSSGCLNGAM